MIAIINYGLGNIKAFANVYKNLNIPFTIASRFSELKYATKLILPGVGAFDHAMELLNNSGMRNELEDSVLNNKIPVLGICVGMQILANISQEGKLNGLGWIEGEVIKFSPSINDKSMIIPHMGWNNVKLLKKNNLLSGIDENARFYFLHSYYFQCKDNENCVAVTDYGTQFACVVNSKNIWGVQFHPEKSHQWGIQVLKNFAEL